MGIINEGVSMGRRCVGLEGGVHEHEYRSTSDCVQVALLTLRGAGERPHEGVPDVVKGGGIGDIKEGKPLPFLYKFHGLSPADGGVDEHDTVLVIDGNGTGGLGNPPGNLADGVCGGYEGEVPSPTLVPHGALIPLIG